MLAELYLSFFERNDQRMKRFVYIILLIAVYSNLYAQTGRISGWVTESTTHKPLPFATVYVNNTTLGTLTNANGEFTLSNLPIGTTEIVFSFIGYMTQQVKVTIKEAGNKPLTVSLAADAQQVSEVNVKASRDKTWEKQLRRFEKVFLGDGTHCKVLNAWAIDFSEENGLTTAKAAIPLEIDNRDLGYKLFFQLKKAEYSATTFSIVGNIRFTEMETTDPAVALRWSKNREEAYRGSIKHLTKSIIDRTITQQGFALYRYKEKGKPRSKLFSFELAHNLVPFDSTSIVSSGNSDEYRIAVRDLVEVHYLQKINTPGFYSDVSDPISWIEVRGGYIRADKNGNILNPTDVGITGNMTDARVSGMLPIDYQPGSRVITQSPIAREAKRLQENVYLQTDKPCYYPGDNLWFSVYMTYRIRSLMDTLSRVVYVDLIDADKHVVQTSVLPIDSGRADGSFRLPRTVKPGNYTLRGYTQWMRNYGVEQLFYKPIPILSLAQRVETASALAISDPSLKILFDKATYQKRSRVAMTLHFDTTGMGSRVTGSFSITVFDETLNGAIAGRTFIKSGTELPDVPSNMPALFKFPIEKALIIQGVCTDKKGKGKKTSFTLLPEQMNTIYPVTTDSHGEFSVSCLAFYDSAQFILQPSETRIKLANRDMPEVPGNLPSLKVGLVSLSNPHLMDLSDTLPVNMLKEVQVAAKKIIQHEGSYGQADHYIKGEEIESYASLADAIAFKIPSFRLVYDQTNWFLIWARSSVPTSGTVGTLYSHEPKLYINDQLVVGESAGDRLMQINPSMVDHIELTGMINANQGANGSAGLINVYTKRPLPVNSRPLSFIKVRGFDRVRTFQSPRYENLPVAATLNDYRSTLYWNPRISLAPTQGDTTFSFFTSDLPGVYRAVLEGITSQGLPIHAEALLTVIE